MTRLKKVAQKGQSQILVEPWLNLEEGDLISLVSQSYDIHYTDDRTVEKYNRTTG